MSDPHYPSVDIKFIERYIKASGKLADGGIVTIGSTTTYIIEGPQAVYKRSILIRELTPGEVCLEQATALALRFSFLGQLLEWLEAEKGWKDGGYICP